MKKIYTAIVFLSMVTIPATSSAAYNDVTLTTDTIITVGGVNLNVSGSSVVVESIIVSTNSFDVTLLTSSSFAVSSADKKGFTISTSGAAVTSTVVCDTSSSTLTLAPSGTAIVTVSLDASCVPSSAVSAVMPITIVNGSIGLFAPVAPSTASTTLSQPQLPPSPYTRSLSVGESGADVEALQTFLEDRGFLVMPQGVAKGYFGALTKQALIKYQRSVGIDPIGILGPATRRQIKKETNTTPTASPQPLTFPYTRSLSVGKSGADVSALQTFLENKGFLVMPNGVAKGYFGDLTKQALIRYQMSVGISPIGIFGPLTRKQVEGTTE